MSPMNASSMKVSVIIPTLHSPLLGEVLQSLSRQRAAEAITEIIVVGQTHPALVPPPAQLIVTERPVAAAVARNIGAQHASGDILLFIDSDCIAHPQLVDRHLRQQQAGHTVVGGSVAIEEPDAYWRLCDNVLTFTPFLSTMPPGQRDYLPSLNLSIRRAIFAEVGGFDERYAGAAGEDVDLSFRLRKRGYPLIFAPDAQVSHRPMRSNPATVAQHLRAFGRIHAIMHRTYNAKSRVVNGIDLHSWAALLIVAAPFLATLDVFKMYWHYPQIRQYWQCLPGMVWGKSAWYWGYAEALFAQRRP